MSPAKVGPGERSSTRVVSAVTTAWPFYRERPQYGAMRPFGLSPTSLLPWKNL